MMAEQAGSTVYEQLARKLDILQKISTNTKLQIPFIQQRKMKGLLRLLRERGEYLQEWEALTKDSGSIAAPADCDEKVQKIILFIKAKQQEIIKDHNAAIAAAKAEKAHIAADLRQVDAQMKLQNSYDYQWMNFSGNRLNQKG